MKLFAPDPDINFEDGFSEKNDIFKRKSFGETLTRIVSSTNSSLTIALEGQWGSGKTTFLKLWAGELRKQGFPVVFFDAFEADFHSDAFLPLVAAIISLAKESKKQKSSSDFAKSATTVGKILARGAIKIGVKAATLGTLNDTDLADVASDIASSASDAVDKHVSEIILGKEKEEAARDAFSNSLSSLVESLNEGKENKRPLIFIIDELDRAKPDFSLSILEKIKHFFARSDIHFIFGTNLDQIRATIKHAYGESTNADIYLEKFIHFSIRLSDDGGLNSSRNAEIYAKKLEESMNFPNMKDNVGSYAVRYIGKIAAIRSINLRSVERIMTNLAIAIASTPERYIFLPAIVSGIAVIKSTNKILFNEIISGKAKYENIIAELGITNEFTEHEDRELNYARQEWKRFLGPLTTEEERGLSSISFNYNFDRREDVIRHIAERFARPTLVRIAEGTSSPA